MFDEPGFAQYDPEVAKELLREDALRRRRKKDRKRMRKVQSYWLKKGLSLRVSYAFAEKYIENVQQLYEFSEKDILKLSNIGPKSIKEINRKL